MKLEEPGSECICSCLSKRTDVGAFVQKFREHKSSIILMFISFTSSTLARAVDMLCVCAAVVLIVIWNDMVV